jgi:C1A family cysteine protease
MKYLLLFTLLFSVILIFSKSSHEGFNLILEDMLVRESKDSFQIFCYIFKKHHYGIDRNEFQKRFEIFRQNVDQIKSWNANENNMWKKGINQFTDLTKEEFENKFLIKNMIENQNLKGPSYIAAKGFKYKNFIVPNNKVSTFKPIDWSKYTGDVRNQQDCGSCYAHVGVNLIESTYMIKTGKSVRLSVQQVVDCNKLDSGCNGGWVTNVGLYSKANGLMNEADYPYINAQGECKYNSSSAKQYIDGMTGHGDLLAVKYHAYSAAFLYEQLKYGPVAVAVDGSALKEYKNDIWNAEGCEKTNHAVMITGFGNNDGVPYFIIKNSWGKTWGENGYAKVYASDFDSAGNCFLYYYSYGAFYNGN